MESEKYINTIKKLLEIEGLKVRKKTYQRGRYGSNYYERGYGNSGDKEKFVWIFTEITIENGRELQRRTLIGSYPMDGKTYKKIVEALSKGFSSIDYFGGRDESEAFTFVGVWDNERFGRHKFS